MNPLEFIQYTARTNCGECGQPSCLAFAVGVTKGGLDPAKCPYLDPAGLTCSSGDPAQEGLDRVERGQEERDLALVEHLKTKIRGVQFPAIAPLLGADCDSQRPDQLIFRYLGREVMVDRETLRMEGNQLVDPRDQILLYNYISSGGGEPPAGDWIGMESLPNSISKVRTLSAYCEQPLARQFSGRVPALSRACEKVLAQPGEENAGTSFSAVIPVLPHLPHYLLFWDEEPEEGFESRVKVLFDSNVLAFLDIESLVFAAERMAEYLMELDNDGTL